MADSLRRVPAWVWLAGIVIASFGLRAWLARGMLGPFIMVDELIYAELGRSIAEDGALRVRDVDAGGFSVVYPFLISPAYALFDELPDAYAAVKTLNALYMSLAAVPAYFLARRILGPPLSLLAALLAVAVPSLVYTGTVMTENVFYPLFLTVALSLVLVLERPTLRRQAILLALVGIAFGTRVQAVAILPAVLVAPLLLALFERRSLRATLSPFRLLYALVAAGIVAVVAAQSVRGRSVDDLLGAYAVVGDGDYELEQVARFALWHAAELDLYLGVLPVAAFVVVTALGRRLGAAVGAFLAATIPLGAALILVVAAFASEFANRIQERNTFVVAPFFLIALLVWVERRLPRPPLLAGAAAIGAALLPLTIPWRFIETGAISDTLALLPIWAAFGSLPFDSIDATVLSGGAIAAALFLLVPRRYGLVLPLATLVFFAVMSWNIWAGERGFKLASAGALHQGIRTGDRNWIDDAVPAGATVAVVWTGVVDRFVVNQNEFFNRSVGPIYYVGGPTPGALAETEVRIDADDGAVRLASTNAALDEEYVLLDGTVSPDRGEELARDPGLGLTLWRLDEPLVASQTRISGLYPNDTWSGRRVTFTRRNCRGGTLRVSLGSDPALFDEAQTVTARVAGRAVARERIGPTDEVAMVVRLRPRDGECRVVFEVAETKVPAEVLGGENADTRELGAHFRDFHVTR